ncbi:MULTISPECIES: MFS transporter [unclassified Spirillospora]|uniref:MFS transporter n=1 Tax=unclassified Spirillospora TaxID=2642701 RepID=UPI003722A6B7
MTAPATKPKAQADRRTRSTPVEDGTGGPGPGRLGRRRKHGREPWRRRLRPRRPHDFTLLWAGSAVSQVGALNMATAAPLLALALTPSPVFAGWVLAVGTIPGLLLHVPAGLVADRVDRRKIMSYCQVVRIVAAAVLAAGLTFFDDGKEVLLITAIAADGCAVAFYNIAETVAVRHVVPRDTLHPAVGKNEARQHMAVLLGRPLGGTLYALGHMFPFVFGVLTALVSCLSLHWMRARDFRAINKRASSAIADDTHEKHDKVTPKHPRTSQDIQQQSPGILAGLKFLAKNRFLRGTLGACALANFLFQTVMLLLVVRAQQEGLPGSKIGLLLATSGLGGVLGSMLAGRGSRRASPRRVVIICGALWLVLILVVAVSQSAIFGLMAWGACGFMGAQINVTLSIYELTEVPPHMQGVVAGFNRFLTTGAISVGALCAGYIVAALDVDGAAILAAGGFTVVALAIPLLLASEHLLRIRPPRSTPAATALAEDPKAAAG